MVIDARTNFGSPIFREICITACWIIWTTRNAVIFYNGQISISNWKISFKEELGLVCTKANAKRQAPLKVWRDSHLFLFCSFSFGPGCLVFFLFLVYIVQSILSFNENTKNIGRSKNRICYFCFSTYKLSFNIKFCDVIEEIISYVIKIYLNFSPLLW